MQPGAPGQPPTGFGAIWMNLGRLVQHFIVTRAHVEIVITLKAGTVQPIRVNQTFLTDQIPRVG